MYSKLGQTVACDVPILEQKGRISLAINDVKDKLGYMSKVINEIETLIFTPQPQEVCCGETRPESPIKTVFGEIDAIHSTINNRIDRLEHIVDGLKRELDNDMRLV